jgi:hypothetical protein
MAIFTAIASAIVSVFTTLGAAATFQGFMAGTLGIGATIGVALVAGGLGIATAKILGPKVPSIQAAKDPGVKVQLQPSTDNRVPVFYGRVHTGAIAVDAGIKNQNNTMVYVYVIGEKTDTGSYTINNIYRGDAKLNFNGGYASATSSSVISVTDPNATSSNNINGKMRCRVYAGNAQSSVNQIFPPAGVKVAAQTLLPTITAATNYEDLVYAVFEVDYDAENGLTGLGQITYDITNSLTEPSVVLKDYLLNDRYGAKLTTADLELPSFTAMQTYCEEQVDYTTTANVTAQHNRWQIDGMLSTYQPVKTNIDKLCQSSATFFTYNPKAGAFSVVPNRAATALEKTNAFLFDNDNIISKIDINSTELYSMYNSIEAEYPAVNQKDQTSTTIVNTPSGDRNTNEPDNGLNVRYELVNDAPRVKNLSNIDLRQSRLDQLITFDADYSGIQVDVGDVVKVTEATYGFSNKLFRVMRTVEKEQVNGMLSVTLVLLEYADSAYTHEVVASEAAPGLSLIPGWWTGIWGNIDYGNIANIIGNITIVDDPLGNVANIVPPIGGGVVGNVDIGNVIYGPGAGGPGIPSINFPITIPNIPDIDKILANLNLPGTNNYEPEMQTIFPTTGSTFVPGEVVNVSIPQPDPIPQDPAFPVGPLSPELLAELQLEFGGVGANRSIKSTTASIALNNRGGITRGTIGDVQAGLQYEETDSNINVANSQIIDATLFTENSRITPADIIDLGGMDYGLFSAINTAQPLGAVDPGGSQVAYLPSRRVGYQEFDIDGNGKYTPNANASIDKYYFPAGIQAAGITSIPILTENFKYEISPAEGSDIAVSLGLPPASATKAYVPSAMIIENWGNSDLATPGTADRGFNVTNLDKRITKSDIYLDIGGFF